MPRFAHDGGGAVKRGRCKLGARRAFRRRVLADAESATLEIERQAVARAQGGDTAALEPLLAAHAEPLFSSVIMPRLGDRALAEDVLKDTFVTAIEKIGGFRWQGRSLFFWLRQIALHKVIDACRRRGRSRRMLEALRAELETASSEEAAADEALIAEEDRRTAMARIERALAELPERYARAIRLRLVEERSREACAEAMGVALGNFDVIFFRAVRAFRKAYGDEA
jgi:RNA polymerase sigma-70 factor (ECF subfamily)